MDPLMQLRSNVRVLTVDHQRMVKREGLIEAGTAAGLIQQLRDEILDGTGMRTGTASGGVPSLVNLAAIGVMERIEKDLKRELRAWHLLPVPGKPEGSIRSWAFLVKSREDLHHTAATITGKWVKSITELFEPVRPVVIRGDCPKCGVTAEQNGRLDDDDNYVHVQPLTRVGDRAACQMCEWAWNGVKELIDLSNALALMDEAVPPNMQG